MKRTTHATCQECICVLRSARARLQIILKMQGCIVAINKCIRGGGRMPCENKTILQACNLQWSQIGAVCCGFCALLLAPSLQVEFKLLPNRRFREIQIRFKPQSRRTGGRSERARKERAGKRKIPPFVRSTTFTRVRPGRGRD